MQQVFKDQQGNYYKLTTAEYLTRNKNHIHGIGLTPNIEVKKVKENDVQLSEAIEYMKDQL